MGVAVHFGMCVVRVGSVEKEAGRVLVVGSDPGREGWEQRRWAVSHGCAWGPKAQCLHSMISCWDSVRIWNTLAGNSFLAA